MRPPDPRRDLAALTTRGLQQRVRGSRPPVVFLVLGATEAHGPHLPLATDTIIADHLARLAALRLEATTDVPALVASPFTATAATCAAGFPGTVSIPKAVETKALVATIRALLDAGASHLVLITLHFDPDHLQAVRDALDHLEDGVRDRVVFPDFTRRENAGRIGGEFATGDCHGGEFETSLMLVAAPRLVDPDYIGLPEMAVGLVQGIRDGKRSFEELGMTQAYCGRPGQATKEEGERLYDVLIDIVVEAL